MTLGQQSGANLKPGQDAIINDLCTEKGILIGCNKGAIPVQISQPTGPNRRFDDNAPELQWPALYSELVWVSSTKPALDDGDELVDADELVAAEVYRL